MLNNLRTHISNYIFELQHKEAIKYKKSYSQCGEDLIVRFIFDRIGIAHPSYLDIGAYHPYIISNTALFYLNGSHGINVEPNPALFKLFIKERQNDINLNIGILNKKDVLNYFCFNEPALNTFSEIEKKNYINTGKIITNVIKIETISIQELLYNYCDNKFPDFLSLDAEGYDEAIIKSIVFSEKFPIVICVETISFSETGNGKKNNQIIEYLLQNNYLLYADTNINSIFVRKENWIKQ